MFRDDPALHQKAQDLSGRVYEFSEFLVNVLGVEEVASGCPGTVTYHPSCHLLREMEVREQPLTLLRHVRDLELKDLPKGETCCGFGGTFSVKFPHISEAMLSDKVENIMSTGAEAVVSCDMGCLMNIEGALSRRGSSVRVRHLAQVLDPKG